MRCSDLRFFAANKKKNPKRNGRERLRLLPFVCQKRAGQAQAAQSEAVASSAAPVAFARHSPESSDREEFGKSNLCFPDSCWNRRQQAAVGTADRQQPVRAGTADQAQPAQSRQRRPAIGAELRRFADFEAFNLWASTVVDRIGGSKWQSALPTRGSLRLLP